MAYGLSRQSLVEVTVQGKSDSTASGFYEDYDLSGVTKLKLIRWLPSATPLPGFISITNNDGDVTFADIPIRTGMTRALELGNVLHNPNAGFVVSASDAGMSGRLVVQPLAYKTSTGAPPAPPPPPPDADFRVFTQPSSTTIVAGQSTQITVSVAPLFGFNQNVTLTADTVITGVSYSFSSNTVQGSGSVVLTITTSASATVATHTVNVTGASGGLSHTTNFSLTINAAATPDFSLSVTPQSATVVQGSATTVTVSNTAISGFSSTITLSATPAITGITYGFSPNPMAAGGSSTFTVTAGAAATTGTQTVTVTATSGALTHTAPLVLTVQASVGSGDTGTAQIQMRSPTSISPTNATFKAYIRCHDYTPKVIFDYRQQGTTTWTSTTPIGRTCHYRWANYYMHVTGLSASTTYEYRVRVLDLATGTKVNNSENLQSGTTVVSFTTKPTSELSVFGSRAITSGVTMPTYALPGNPASGLITEANPRQFTSLCQRAGGASLYDIIVYGTDNPSAKTAGTVELYYIVTASAGTDLFTTTSQSVHFLSADTPIVFTSTGTVPAPLVSGTTYYVRTPTSSAGTFEVAAAPGGAKIDLTTAGTGTITAKATTSYSSYFLANALKNHSVIGTVCGIEGADGPRVSYATPIATALAAAGWTNLYDSGGTGVTGGFYGIEIGGGTGSDVVTWPGNVCVTGVSVVGIGTVSKLANPPQVAGEPIIYASFSSTAGGCNNIYFKNVKTMAVPGNTARIAVTGSSVDSIDTGSSQFAGLLGFYNCEFRSFRENLQPIAVDVDGNGSTDYSNEQGWGTKSHMRMAGNSRIDCRTCRASWTTEHWWYNEGTSADTSGTDGSWFIDCTDFSGMRGTVDLVQTGFGRPAFQFTTRASPDSFKFKQQFFSGQIAHIHQLDDPAKFQQNNYIDGAPGRGTLTFKNCNLNGYEGAGSAGSFPYAIYGHLGNIRIDSCTVGYGSGFGIIVDTGKGHYMIDGGDGFWYAQGPVLITGTGLTYSTSSTYLVAALCLNGAVEVDIAALSAGTYGATMIGHYVSGQAGKNGNANAAIGPVDDGPILGPCGRIRHNFGSVYAGWPGGSYSTGEIAYRFKYSDEHDYTASNANAFNGVWVTRGDVDGTNYINP